MSELFVCRADGCDFRTESMGKFFEHIDTHNGKAIISYDCTVCKLFLKNNCEGNGKSCDKWCR